jgi:hypothetical protein
MKRIMRMTCHVAFCRGCQLIPTSKLVNHRLCRGPFARRSPAPAPTPAVQGSGRSSRSSTRRPHPAASQPAVGSTAFMRRAPALDSPPLAVGLSLEPAAALAGAPAHHR